MQEIVKEVKRRKAVIIYDENKAVISIPAEIVSGDIIKLMMKNCNEIRLAMPWIMILKLGLNRFKFLGNIIPIDFKRDSTTDEKAQFIRNLVNGNIDLTDIVYPGRIFIEEAKEGGVLERPKFGEASLDIARMCGFKLAGVYSILTTDDGNIANIDYALKFAEKMNLPVISINQLIEYRLRHEKLIERVVEITLPTKFYGTFKAIGYKTPIGEIVALVKGNVTEGDVLVRIHSECLTGDVFHSLTYTQSVDLC